VDLCADAGHGHRRGLFVHGGAERGRGLWKRVSATANAGMLGNLVLTGSLIALIVLLDRHVLGWFLPGGSLAGGGPPPQPHRHGSFLFFGVTFVLAGVVRSTGP
jgi:Na+-driven multidrug efflux pump